MTTTEQKWEHVTDNAMCDTSAGEKYMEKSPGKLPTLKLCQEACEDDVECKSITYFKTSWCSFFSTPCTATKWTRKAVSMRLFGAATSTIPTDGTKAYSTSKGFGATDRC